MAAANRSRSEDSEAAVKNAYGSKKTGGKSTRTSKGAEGKSAYSSSERTESKNPKRGEKAAASQKKTNLKESPELTGDGNSGTSSLKIEIALMAVIVVSVLMILGFFGIGGVVGAFFGKIAGVFGLLGYLFPFALFIGVAFGAVNHGKAAASRKLYGGIGLYLALCSLIQLITYGGGSDKKFLSYLNQPWKNKNGGGVIGGLIVKGLFSVLGTAGTYVVLIAVILALLMLITEKFLFAFLGKKGKESYEVFVERQEERRQEKLKKKAVTFNMVAPSYKKSETKGNGQKKEDSLKAQDNELKYFPINRGEAAEKPYSAGNADTKKETPVYQQELDKKFKGSGVMEPDVDMQDGDREDRLPPSLDFDFGVLDSLTNQNEVEENSTEVLLDAPDREDAETETYTESVAEEKTENNQVLESAAFETGTDEAAEKSKAVETDTDEAVVKSKAVETDTDKAVEESKVNKEISGKAAEENRAKKEEKPYVFPPYDLLHKSKVSEGNSDKVLRETAGKLKSTLESFGVRAAITNVSCGPTVTRYEIQPEQGVKVSRITGLTDDIKLNLAASEIRIEAPIPGKAAVGIEVPNKEVEPVSLRDLIESPEFKKSKSKVTFAVGKDIGNQTIVTDIAKMPHVLIAGATGAGKSVCINTLIISIIYKANPKDVKLILIDPKVVELSIYNEIPHLLVPVVTDCKKALGALNWAVAEMTERYRKFSEMTVRDLEGYNKKIAGEEYKDKGYEKLPQIVIIVDEMADLMMVAQGDVEGAIVRLTQLARAAGIHLVIATQRPSVNVITGLIKANIPSRIAFSVSSQVDSRTILDGSGAEHLLGRGDMLFAPRDLPKPIRVQGAFVSDDEVNAVVEFLKKQNEDNSYDTAVSEKIEAAVLEEKEDKQQESEEDDRRDSYFGDAGRLIINKNKASIGLLQRALKIGFNRAARIMDQLCEYGVVGEEQGTKPREILMSMESFEELLNS